MSTVAVLDLADRHTLEELNNYSQEELITIVLMMQGQLDTLNENIERLIEQVRIANSYRFGKHTESWIPQIVSCIIKMVLPQLLVNACLKIVLQGV